MVLTASEGKRKLDVPISVIVTVGRVPIIVYETGVTGEKLLSADTVSTVRPCCMFDGHRNQVFSFTEAADCLSHYLRPKGYALQIIEQKVAVMQ